MHIQFGASRRQFQSCKKYILWDSKHTHIFLNIFFSTEKYVLGGCNVSEYNPNFYCDSCKKSFGAKTEKIPGTIVKPLTMKPADRKIVFGKKNNKK